MRNRRRTVAKEPEHAMMLTALHEVAIELAAAQESEALLQLVVQRATELVGVDAGGLYLYHPEERELELVVSYNLGRDMRGVRLKVGEGLAGFVAEKNRSLLIDDYQHWEGRAQAYKGFPITSSIAVPIRWRGEVIGALNVHALRVQRRFSREDKRLLELLAGHAAIAIGKAREEREIQRLRQLLLEIGQQILGSTDIEAILRRVAGAIHERSPFKLVAISLFERPIDPSQGEGGRIAQTMLAGLSGNQAAKLHRVATSGEFIPCYRILQRGKVIGRGYYVSPQLIPEIVPRGVKGRVGRKGPDAWGSYDNFYFFLRQRQKIIGRISLGDPVHGRIPTPEELEPLELCINLVALALEKARNIKELRELAIHDPLTGLYNRRYLDDVLKREMARSRRYGHPISLLIIDLDGFHRVNDTMGHLAGDRVLAQIAALIKDELREADFVFRFGGDEFLILMPETNGNAQQIIERLQRAMARWNEASGLSFPLGFSLGLSTWHPAAGRSFDEVLAEADQKMYAEKRGSRPKGEKR